MHSLSLSLSLSLSFPRARWWGRRTQCPFALRSDQRGRRLGVGAPCLEVHDPVPVLCPDVESSKDGSVIWASQRHQPLTLRVAVGIMHFGVARTHHSCVDEPIV